MLKEDLGDTQGSVHISHNSGLIFEGVCGRDWML